MHIIAIVGPHNCGKTATMVLVYEGLLQLGAVSTQKKQEGADSRDLSDILLWQGKKIAFFTMGDYSKYLMEAIRDFESQNIDMLVCACNDRFKRPVRAFARHDSKIIYKTVDAPAEWEKVNGQIAREIIEMIK